MSGKFMSVKRYIIPTITMVIIASQLMGCAAATQSELLEMINRGDQIEIEVAVPADVEQGTAEQLIWEELASITTNDVLRKEWDNILGIINTDTGKNGVLYVDASGVNINNNTLRMALRNRAFVQYLEKEASLEALAKAVQSQYADLDEDAVMKAVYMGINGYFNLLPDNTPNYCNPDALLNRLEFMSMVMRAENPVQEIKADNAFVTAVGSNDLNIYAQEVAESSYLDLASKSLNNQSANGTMTRAEAVYLLMQRYFSDELATVDVSNIKLDDCIDGGNIAEQQKFIEDGVKKTYWKSYELTYIISQPDEGVSTDLYRAICLASQKGIISTETRFDEGITKSEAVEMLVKTLQSEPSVAVFNATMGTTSGYEVSDTDTEKKEVDVNSVSDNIVLGEDEYKGDEEPASTPEPTAQPEVKIDPNNPKADTGIKVGPDGKAVDGSAVDLNGDGYISNEEYQYFQDFLGLLDTDYLVDDALKKQEETNPGGNGGSSQPGPTGEKGGMETREDQTEEPDPDFDWGSGDSSGGENIVVN